MSLECKWVVGISDASRPGPSSVKAVNDSVRGLWGGGGVMSQAADYCLLFTISHGKMHSGWQSSNGPIPFPLACLSPYLHQKLSEIMKRATKKKNPAVLSVVAIRKME